MGTKQNDTGFQLNVKVTNERGAWVRLRTYPHPGGFYHVYGFDHWSPTFSPEIEMAESVTNMSRAKIERQMRNWLRNR
jgi:hypothetical protein